MLTVFAKRVSRGLAMYKAIDIANFFIDLAHSDEEGYITKWKLKFV